MKKILIKTIIYLVILLSIPYLYFVWQAKQGVDSFLLSHPMDGEFQYQWIWIDLDGKITLTDVSFFQQRYDAVFSADRLEIVPTSIFDLLDAREHIIYKEYPPQLDINLLGAKTTQTKSLFKLFNLEYDAGILPFLYPSQCLAVVDKSLPTIKFDFFSRFETQRTADESNVNFSFSSLEFVDLNGKFKINKFSDEGADGAYISNLSLSFDKLSWLHQNTQKCLTELKLTKDQFLSTYSQSLVETLKTQNLLVSEQTALNYADFFYTPQTIQLSFDVQEQKTFSQISVHPVDQYQKKTGLKILLNKSQMNDIFEPYTYQKEVVVVVEDESLDSPPVPMLKKSTHYLNVHYRSLKKHLGSKVIITLTNDKKLTGYLDVVHNDSLQLKQLKYKGKAELLFPYNEIQSIYLLVAEK